jgi:hypothetical protein
MERPQLRQQTGFARTCYARLAYRLQRNTVREQGRYQARGNQVCYGPEVSARGRCSVVRDHVASSENGQKL